MAMRQAMSGEQPMDDSNAGYPAGNDADLTPDTAVMMRLLIALMGDEVSAYGEAVRPPEHLRQAVRCAPTPVLRGVLMDAAAELDRRGKAAAE